MSLARVTTWNLGDTVTAVALNGEFNNIINNPISLISPATADVDLDNHLLVDGIYKHTPLTFAAQDGTPDVSGGTVFKTANTSATTISTFDSAVDGQTIWVIVNDANTTFDFSGTNLKGNGGADWSATTGDSLQAVFVSPFWYCRLSGVTSGGLGGTIQVVATGSSLSRSLADRFADVINAKDYTTLNNAHAAAVTAAKKIIYVPDGTYNVTSEILSDSDDVEWVLAAGAIINISSMIGAGTANVHDTVNVLAAFKITGARVRVSGGRITGATSSAGKNLVGVLAHGSARTYIADIKIDTLYCGIWAGNGATDFVVDDNVEVTSCSRNILLGYMPLSAANPQVTRATFNNVNSHNAVGGDGLKGHTHAFDVTIKGGFYNSNSNNGVDLYVGMTRSIVDGVHADLNTVDGIALKYAVDTGTGANKLGITNRNIITSNHCRANTRSGIYALVDADYTGTTPGLEDTYIDENFITESGSHGIQANLFNGSLINNKSNRNIGRGYHILSCTNCNISGNDAIDNGTGTTVSGFVFGLGQFAGATNSIRCTIARNQALDTRSGASRTQTRGFELANLTDSFVSNNIGFNGSTADWLLDATASSLVNIRFLDNDGAIEDGSKAVIVETTGAGTPEGAVIAAIGSRFRRTDGGAGTSLYIKESGTGNTGWVAK